MYIKSIIQKICNNNIINKNFTTFLSYGSKERKNLKKQLGYNGLVQDHHCIPKEFKNHKLIRILNYDINSSDNLYIMPNNLGIKKLNIHPKTLVHDGGHLNYNIYVKTQLDWIYYTNSYIDWYIYNFWLLRDHLKKNMRFNQDKLPWK